ncbi:transmembrane protein [Ceratobasidium sp. AG-Ba]|nr:transmembrane protein [Ceratobasidium sp. AG-Ba]
MILARSPISILCVFFVSLPLVWAQSPIRIDDTYTFGVSSLGGIQFGGAGWDNYNPGHAISRYNGSITVTNTPDANIVFFFRGKSIKYYSDRDPKGGSASIRIDGEQSTTVGVEAPPSGFLFQELLWTSPALDAGDHQIVISNVGAKINPQKGIIGLDFFEIVPLDGANDVTPSSIGPGASNVPQNAVIVHDSDGTITYSGSGWGVKNSIPDSSIYLQGSAHTTTTPGDSCSFRFIGTDVWYFTDYAMGNAPVEIRVDGGPPERVTAASDTQISSYTQRMTWGKTGLKDAPHTVTIKHAGQSGSSMSVDFFRYIPGTGAEASLTSSGSTVGATSSAGSASSKSAPVSVIVGSSVGGFAVLTLLVLGGVLLFWRRRGKDQGEIEGHADEKQAPSWNSPPNSAHPSAVTYGGMTNNQSYGQYPRSQSTVPSGAYSGHPEVQHVADWFGLSRDQNKASIASWPAGGFADKYDAVSRGIGFFRLPRPYSLRMMTHVHGPLRLFSFLVLLNVCRVWSQSPIRVDDTFVYNDLNSNGIQFSSSRWSDYSPQNDPLRYNDSYTATNSSGANLRYTNDLEVGKSIKYYGDKDPSGGIATVRIDGQPYTNVSVSASSSGFQAQQLLWTSPSLDSNDHQIVISNIGARINPRKGLIGLDFFEIVPNSGANGIAPANLGPGASSVPQNAILVDSFHPSISYLGDGWQNKTSTPDSTIYLRGSARTTRFPGDSCYFNFNGSAVWYFTDYSLVNAVIAISVDGAPPELVDTAPNNTTLSRSQRLTWSRTNLTDGPHTIAVTHSGLAGSWATVDFFKYMPSSNSTTGATTSTTRTSSTSATKAASTNNIIPSSGSNSSIGGAIAGAIIGGILLLILITFGILVMMRRRRAYDRMIKGANEKSWNSLPTSSRHMLGQNASTVSHSTSYRTGRSVI